MNTDRFSGDTLFRCQKSSSGLWIYHPEQCRHQEVCGAFWSSAHLKRIRALSGFAEPAKRYGYAEICYGRNLIILYSDKLLSISIPSNAYDEIQSAAKDVGCYYKSDLIKLERTPGTHWIHTAPPINELTLKHEPLIKHPWVMACIDTAFSSDSDDRFVHLTPCYYHLCAVSSEDQAVVFEVAPDAAEELRRGMTVWAYWYADDSIALVIKFENQEFHATVPEEYRLEIMNLAIADFRLWELGREEFYPPAG